jgi:hypothetical protein
LYAGADRLAAESITMQIFEGEDYTDFGAADHTLQIWEDGIKVDEIVEYTPYSDDNDFE